MSYELARNEALGDGIRRILIEQVDSATDALDRVRGHGGLDEPVHEARKCFKRVRSGLRLVRTLLRRKHFRREDRRFRLLGQLLSGPRESGVAVMTIDQLARTFGPVLQPTPFAEIRAHFVERHHVALWHTVERESALVEARAGLVKAQKKLGRLPIASGRDLAWREGVREVYKAGARRMRTSMESGAPETFHEWRKQAKHLRYHLQALQPAWCGRLDRAQELLHDLTDLLGVHHDLTDLRRQLEWNAAAHSTPTRRSQESALRALIEGRRIQLEGEAIDLGRRIYSRRAGAVIGRLESHWHSWRPIPR